MTLKISMENLYFSVCCWENDGDKERLTLTGMWAGNGSSMNHEALVTLLQENLGAGRGMVAIPVAVMTKRSVWIRPSLFQENHNIPVTHISI